jgi:calcineurin-like phosphoesterase family protein
MHYPIEEWDGFFRGSYHLYGHVHNNDNGLRIIDRRYNVGVDVNDFEPKTLDELIEVNK